MQNLTDIQLIEKAKNGNELALDFLLGKYKKMANKIARSYFLIGAEYDDLLQEAMIGLYKAYMGYDPKSKVNFSTFAHKCITRSVQTAVKIANRKKNQMLNNSISLSSQGAIISNSEDDDEEINLVLPSSILTPDQILIEGENFENVKESIKNTLSKFELDVLGLFLKGLSYTQIAERLNQTNKSVDNALSRIRNKLSFLKTKK